MANKEMKEGAYASNIFPDDKKKNAAAKADAVEDAQNEIVNAIFGAKKAIRAAEKSLNSARYAVPLNPATVIERQMALEDAQDNLEALEGLKKELGL